MPYVAGLDGLRALAVIAVLLYHGEVSWMPGGYLGVEVFFVISGYLITALLLEEHQGSGTIDLRSFWGRRARRLLPAVYALLIGVVLLAAIVATDALDGLFTEIVAAVLYVTNWLLIAADQSYFETFGRPSPLQHLWSLAIEEQFYLVWPAVLLFGLRRVGRLGMLTLAIAGVIASTALMWSLYEPFADPSRLYYGTDTRAAGLLLGAALAFVWKPWAAGGPWSRQPGPFARIVDGFGVISLACVGWLLMNLSETTDWLYQGGFLVTSVATAGVVAATMVPDSILAAVLGVAPLRWIGQRSYGIYLWHWPIFVFTRPRLDTTLDGYELLGARIGLTLLAAEVSYRAIEMPFRQGRYRLRRRPMLAKDPYPVRPGLIAATVALVAVAAVPTAVVALRSPELAGEPLTAQELEAILDPEDDHTSAPATGPSASGVAGPEMSMAAPVVRTGLVAIGDSVMAGAMNEIATTGAATVDAAVGRRWWSLADDIQADLSAAETVLLHLGNNGPPESGDIDAVIQQIGSEVDIVLMTVRVPRRWESFSNQALWAARDRYENVRILDWYAISNQNYSWFEPDGVHLNPLGQAAYASVIADVIGF